jgi:hypothetical protein
MGMGQFAVGARHDVRLQKDQPTPYRENTARHYSFRTPFAH